MIASLEDIRRAVDQAGSNSAAARMLGVNESTVRRRLRDAGRQPVALTPSEKPRIRVQAGGTTVFAPTADLVRVFEIPDGHDSPALRDKSRYRHIGAQIAEEQPDVVVDIGDSIDLDSVSFHTGNGTLAGKLKPSFMADMESYNRSQEAMWNEVEKRAPRYKPKKRKTRGNHENRLWRFEDANPEVAGMMQVEYEAILSRYGWVEAPYGVYVNVAGVDFVHTPLTKMGKPRGGENAATIMARKAVRDLVVGHTHNAQQRCETKDGQDERVRVFETGTSLPWGHIQEYAQHVATGWWWGCNLFLIRNGRIEGWEAIPMFELERRYG